MKHTWKPENRRRLRLLIFLLALLVLELAAFPITSHIREKRLKQKYAEEARIEEEKKLIEEPEQADSAPVVFINYKPVNGYIVTVTWFPWAGKGDAGYGILKFVHTSEIPEYGTGKQEFHVFNPRFSDLILDSLLRSSYVFHDGETFNLEYVSPKKDEFIGHNTPFQFSDVDFDGEKELLINNWRDGHRDWNKYDVYKIHPYYAEQLTNKPFDYLVDGDRFDFKKKTITQWWSSGWDSFTKLVYGYHKPPATPKLQNEDPFIDFHYPIRLDSLISVDNGHTSVYARQRDDLILIDEF